VQTAWEDGRARHGADLPAGRGDAAPEGDAALEGGEPAEEDAADAEWTAEELSDAAMLVSSVLAAHAAELPAVRALARAAHARSGAACVPGWASPSHQPGQQ